ncbi:MAG: hypothetical protein U1F43_25735 [Myxococcota bacterium]
MARLKLVSAGVALTSGAALALSLLFSRLFSVTMYYHFAFFIVSLALLGIALGGVLVYILPKVFREERMLLLAGLFAAAVAPLTLFAIDVAVSNPMSVDLAGDNVSRLLKVYFATSLPFFASGLAITLVMASAKEHIGRIYAFDLGGAALGCLAIIPLISAAGGPGALAAAGGISAIGGLLLCLAATTTPKKRIVAAAVAGVTALVGLYMGFGPARTRDAFRFVQGSKFLVENDVIWEGWNALSRITVSTSGNDDHRWIHIDADAATRIWSADVTQHHLDAPRRYSEHRVSALVYSVRNEGPALIIGPGGGPDVVAALRGKVPRVVGVEVNPLIAETVMKGAFAEFSGNLYNRPDVNVVVDDGRSFVRRSEEAFSSIQATLVDTWAASSAGAFALTENNLYTADAFEEYLDKLQPQGILSMTRWYGKPPREFIRLLGLGREALSRRGVPEAEHARHFFVAADNRMATMLLKREPFTDAELATLDRECRAAQLTVFFRPASQVATGSSGAAKAVPELADYFATAPADYYAKQDFDARPTTDDRPFFFYTVWPSDFMARLGQFGNFDRNNLGLALLQLVLLVSLVLTILLVLVPLFVFRRGALRENRGDKVRVLLYFMSLGFGFILVELGLMQRFVLFLGHPIYALAVVIAALLLSSGIGSALSPRLVAKYGLKKAIRVAMIALVLTLLAYLFVLPPLFQGLLGLPLELRIVIAALLVGVLGTVMGMMLPLGVRTALGIDKELVPWGWGINGATSVVGSALAVVLSMNVGFSATLVAGLVAYLFGGLAIGRAAGKVSG